MMDLPVPESRIILRPEDVPGALLQEHIEIADHSKLQLQRWLECRSLKKTGTKSELVQRVIDCIQAGRKDQIFLGIDNGKWYDLKRNTITNPTSSVVPAATTITTNWKKFPSCSIPKYFNKGYIYSYLVGTRFETEDYEVHYDEAGITEKPFRRGTQFVGSDYIHDVYDMCDDKRYYLKAKCFSSFHKKIHYMVSITLNQLSGAVISGMCNCKQSALGKCSHVSALLLFLAKYAEEYGYDGLASTSKLRQSGLGAKNKKPSAVASKEYPTVRFNPLKRSVFDPRPKNYTRSVNLNNFICDLQCGTELTMFQTLFNLSYEDFSLTEEDIGVLLQKVQLFKKNMYLYMNNYSSKVFAVKGAEIQGSLEWKTWRSYFLTASNTKTAVSLSSPSAKFNFLKKNLWQLSTISFLPAIIYGKKNEPNAVKSYISKHLKSDEEFMQVGLYVNKDFPHLACSVDGVIKKNGKISRILEIKCPKTLENKDPNLFEEVLTKSQKNAFFAFKEDGQTKLKSNHPYLYQVVTSMLVFEVPICDIVVWSNINILVFQVKLEKIETIVIDNILIKLKKVYYNMYIPELFLMKVPRNLTVFELE